MRGLCQVRGGSLLPRDETKGAVYQTYGNLSVTEVLLIGNQSGEGTSRQGLAERARDGEAPRRRELNMDDIFFWIKPLVFLFFVWLGGRILRPSKGHDAYVEEMKAKQAEYNRTKKQNRGEN